MALTNKRSLTKKYYKVTDGAMRSLAATGEAEVFYEKGGWVSAPKWLSEKGYGLFIFDDLKAAKSVRKTYPRSGLKPDVIWEVKVSGIFKSLPVSLDLAMLSIGEIAEDKKYNFPPGTVMVKKVKLIKRWRLGDEQKQSR